MSGDAKRTPEPRGGDITAKRMDKLANQKPEEKRKQQHQQQQQ